MSVHQISTDHLSLQKIKEILDAKRKLVLSEDVQSGISHCREFLDQKLSNTNQPVYGINTGFGSLYNKNISKKDLNRLQENLVRSHACGTGDRVPDEIVRLMLLLKIQSLAYGHSGAQLSTVERLIDFYNEGIYPVVYEMGSLGASGDLAPLAHLSLPLIGEGEVAYQGNTYLASEILPQKQWDPLRFEAKEGLALLNGTQFMTAYGVWCLIHTERLLALANLIGALSLDCFDGRIGPFRELIQNIRPQKGQAKVAREIRNWLSGSELIDQPGKHVQDPYSFRCIPQVHGATADTLRFTREIFTIEVNSVTDNPNIFPEHDEIISAGNFHGQSLALSLDFLGIALAELGSISERRTFQLISGARNLPNYLVANPGINSGLMIPQYTAAALVSQNKQYCSPASVDSIVSSNGQEDHVSMGANAATKTYRIVQNLYSILAIELITAAQALWFRRPLKTSPALEKVVDNFREKVSFIENDRILHEDIARTETFLKEIEIGSDSE